MSLLFMSLDHEWHKIVCVLCKYVHCLGTKKDYCVLFTHDILFPPCFPPTPQIFLVKSMMTCEWRCVWVLQYIPFRIEKECNNKSIRRLLLRLTRHGRRRRFFSNERIYSNSAGKELQFISSGFTLDHYYRPITKRVETSSSFSNFNFSLAENNMAESRGILWGKFWKPLIFRLMLAVSAIVSNSIVRFPDNVAALRVLVFFPLLSSCCLWFTSAAALSHLSFLWIPLFVPPIYSFPFFPFLILYTLYKWGVRLYSQDVYIIRATTAMVFWMGNNLSTWFDVPM